MTSSDPARASNPDPVLDHGTGERHDAPPRTVSLFLWDGVELLDFAGPAQVFQVAGEGRAFRLETVSPGGEPVTSQSFLKILPDRPLEGTPGSSPGEPGTEEDEAVRAGPYPDLLVIPGGETEVAAADPRVMDWLPGAVERAGHVLSVCTGALLLARIGVLAGREATTWHEALSRLKALEPRATLRPDLRWVSSGKVTTAAGVTAGIDAALHLVEEWLGASEAERVTRYMEHRRVRRPDEDTG